MIGHHTRSLIALHEARKPDRVCPGRAILAHVVLLPEGRRRQWVVGVVQVAGRWGISDVEPVEPVEEGLFIIR